MSGFLSSVKSLSSLVFAARDLLDAQKKNLQAFEVIAARLEKLEQRMTYLEANERMLVVQAGAAASAAATGVASAMTNDVVTRITRLEERAKRVRDDRPARISHKNPNEL